MVLRIWNRAGEAYQDIVKFNVVVGVTRLVDQLDLVQELQADLVGACLAECFFSVKEDILESLSKLLLDDV